MSGPWGDPRANVERALAELDRFPLHLVRQSALIDTDPFGKKNQPRFVNAVAEISTHLPPEILMRKLLQIERLGGRKRNARWGPRTIDLDLLDYNGRILRFTGTKGTLLSLPHPGMTDRSFVLEPISEIAPHWLHPVFKTTVRSLKRKLPA